MRHMNNKKIYGGAMISRDIGSNRSNLVSRLNLDESDITYLNTIIIRIVDRDIEKMKVRDKLLSSIDIENNNIKYQQFDHDNNIDKNIFNAKCKEIASNITISEIEFYYNMEYHYVLINKIKSANIEEGINRIIGPRKKIRKDMRNNPGQLSSVVELEKIYLHLYDLYSSITNVEESVDLLSYIKIDSSRDDDSNLLFFLYDLYRKLEIPSINIANFVEELNEPNRLKEFGKVGLNTVMAASKTLDIAVSTLSSGINILNDLSSDSILTKGAAIAKVGALAVPAVVVGVATPFLVTPLALTTYFLGGIYYNYPINTSSNEVLDSSLPIRSAPKFIRDTPLGLTSVTHFNIIKGRNETIRVDILDDNSLTNYFKSIIFEYISISYNNHLISKDTFIINCEERPFTSDEYTKNNLKKTDLINDSKKDFLKSLIYCWYKIAQYDEGDEVILDNIYYLRNKFIDPLQLFNYISIKYNCQIKNISNILDGLNQEIFSIYSSSSRDLLIGDRYILYRAELINEIIEEDIITTTKVSDIMLFITSEEDKLSKDIINNTETLITTFEKLSQEKQELYFNIIKKFKDSLYEKVLDKSDPSNTTYFKDLVNYLLKEIVIFDLLKESIVDIEMLQLALNTKYSYNLDIVPRLDISNITKIDLSNRTLQDINLSKVRLDGLILTGAKLIRANMSMSILSNCNLFKVKILHSDLSGVILINCNLSHAKIYKTNLSIAYFNNVNLNNSRLSDTDLNKSFFHKTTLIKASFHKINLESSAFNKVLVYETTFDQTQFNNIYMVDTKIRYSVLDSSHFTNALISLTEFIKCSLNNAVFKNTTIIQSYFINNEMVGAFISTTYFFNTQITKCNLSSGYLRDIVFNTTPQNDNILKDTRLLGITNI